MAMSDELDELIGFLSAPSSSPQVKKAAVEIVQGLTGTREGIKSLLSKADSLSGLLIDIIKCEEELSKPAIEALINLSQEPQFAEAITKASGIEKAMDFIGKLRTSVNRLLVMLIVNLTQSESGASRLLQETEQLEGLYLRKLVRLFSKSPEEDSEDQYEHVSSILVNISRLKAGRKLLLDPKRGLLNQILPQADARSMVRRKGVAGAVRNCCFEADEELPGLLLASQYLWPALLLPLAGKQAYSSKDTSKMPLELGNPLSHEREPETDPHIRIEAAEALYLIAMHEGGRRALWSVNGPRILEVGYECEEDPKVMEAYERLGSLDLNRWRVCGCCEPCCHIDKLSKQCNG